jgi:hypothetical protein
MADKTTPSPGPWVKGNPTPSRPTYKVFNAPFGLGDIAEVHIEADADLIVAAGVAAHELVEMGLDPFEAIRALPQLYREHRIAYPTDRTRAVGKEGAGDD